jgi:hypothetical protein
MKMHFGRAVTVWIEDRVWLPLDEVLATYEAGGPQCECERELLPPVRRGGTVADDERDKALAELSGDWLAFIAACVVRDTWPDIFTGSADAWLLARLRYGFRSSRESLKP